MHTSERSAVVADLAEHWQHSARDMMRPHILLAPWFHTCLTADRPNCGTHRETQLYCSIARRRALDNAQLVRSQAQLRRALQARGECSALQVTFLPMLSAVAPQREGTGTSYPPRGGGTCTVHVSLNSHIGQQPRGGTRTRPQTHETRNRLHGVTREHARTPPSVRNTRRATATARDSRLHCAVKAGRRCSLAP